MCSVAQLHPILCDLVDCSPPGSSVHGSFQARILAAAAAAKSLQSCPTLCDPIGGSPPGSPRPWDSPGKNTGVDCHFLLQCMKVKSEREVVQSCPTLCDPMDCSPPDSSIHGIFQARVLEWGSTAFSEWLPFPPPGNLPDTGTEPTSLVSPALEGGFFTTEPPGKPGRARGDPKSRSSHYSWPPLCFYRKNKKIKTWPLLSRSLGPNGTARHVNEYWLAQKESLFRFSIASYEKPN